MSDFCCTNTVQVCIRNQGTEESPEYRLHYIVNQRSCDAIYGLKNDLFWHRHVIDLLINDLKDTYSGIKAGNLIHQVGSLHIYERHFKFIEECL
jgi:thymidylate synthase